LEINAMPELASSSFSSHRHIIAYWITTILVVFELALGGVWDILRVPQARGLIERLGYPVYFLVILGIWKLLGAVALVIPRFPRLKEWAYAGVIFDLTGAVASLLASGLIDAGTVAYPVVMTGVAVASWGSVRHPAALVPVEVPLSSRNLVPLQLPDCSCITGQFGSNSMPGNLNV
jgi:uncharacterized membrane protein YphA (DoxX/SURF4 family)